MNTKEIYYGLGKAIYKIDGAYSIFTKNTSISSAMLWVLYAMNDGKNHTQKQIIKDWNMKKTTVNTVIKDLERKGYITLKSIPSEKREMIIELTDVGKEFANQVLLPVYEMEEKFIKEYQKEHDINFINELICFANALTKFYEENNNEK